MSDRYLVLENGTTFKGKAFGADKDVIGEVVFTTAMVGYVETLTDPSYYGQIVTQTFPLIGNYGIIDEDFESSAPKLFGYIVKTPSDTPSNYRMNGKLDDFLKQCGIPGLYGIDTRALTKIIREAGVMNGMITDDLSKVDYEAIRDFSIKNALSNVSTPRKYTVGKGDKKVVLLDYGYKGYILKELLKRDLEVTIMPYDSTAEEILAEKPDGIMLSNGPGDPKENIKSIETLKKLIPHKIPTFGICLGHQLLALANGFETSKLKYGHRGGNQPCKEIESGKTYITTQNHGYQVVSESIDPQIAVESFVNVNDGTCEGINYINTPAFTAQFHPEAHNGPTDTNFLFDKFVKLMEVNKCH